ncbi:ABZJ_00895 family protein [Phyllobacterium myrsinacearum]|uniref:Uncharacterized protein n=1 Tax=Phyllobacterium myrsinacearum TaxID=28101 RepID=A0A839EIU0_9HYPH|nr:ABZJ_00895 family protein [Phyllobacterium myrsinacearum]MBA8879901.1 hypothetical protein [Phyllobacterium myrsinacearum]
MSSSPVQTSLTPTLIRFILAFILCVIVVQVAIVLLNLKMPSAMGIITLVAALAPAFDLFARTTGRVMTSGEKVRFSLSVAIITLVINIATLLVFTYLAMGSISLANITSYLGLGQIDPFFVTLLVGLGLVIAFVITYFSAGFMGRGALKRLAKAK